MTEHMKKLSIRIIIAVVIGLYPASLTDIKGPCKTAPPDEDITKCVEYSEAIFQPSKLLSNEQDSLVRFMTTFATVSITSFTLLSVYSWYKNRKD